jgi:hypothetical protein
MEQVDFLAIWRQTQAYGQVKTPLVRVNEAGGQKQDANLAFQIGLRKGQTAWRQAGLLENTARQAELDLARFEWGEWLLVRGIEASAQHIHALHVWADECSTFCHPKAVPYIGTMVEQGATVLSRLPMAAFIQNIRRHGLG